MQAVLLPAFCASGSRNPIRIKPYRKQVERVFLDGVLLLQPPGCLPGASPAPIGSSMARLGDGKCHIGAGVEQLLGICPSWGCTAWLRQWWDQNTELPGSAPDRQW